MPTPIVHDIQLCYAVADLLGSLEFPHFEAVFVGGVGTDWMRAPAYPYAIVRVESAEEPRGSVTRTVRVRIASRESDDVAASKPIPLDNRKIILLGYDDIVFMASAIRNALAAASLGAPLESIATEYDAESQFPVQFADLALTFTDEQAFGDSF